ncbi:MAG TPA: peroxiredoxin family protein [Fimbriimonas sp.]|nr:peroxiredoxin family protein [Fimbriimonas sp.]
MIRNGEPAPTFTLTDAAGDEYSISSFGGKPVILLFFRGTFCPSSRKSLVSWQDFSKSVNDLGFGLLALSGDSAENLAPFAEQYGLKMPLLIDSDLEVSKGFGVYIANNRQAGDYGEPALVIVDAKGRIAFSIISSGPKGMPEPGAIASMMIFMSKRNGMY